MVASVGTLGQMGFTALASASGAATLRIDYQDEDLVLAEEFRDTNGLRGTLDRAAERVRAGNRAVRGPVRLQPNSLEWTYLLQWMLGGTPSGSGAVTYPLGETAPFRGVTIDRVGKVFSYTTVGVSGWSLRGSEGNPLELSLNLVGIDETVGNAATFPALPLDTTTQPFMFTDCVFSLNSTTVTVKDFELSMDNRIDDRRFFNSQTLSALVKLDRHTSLNVTLPYGDWTALYNTGVAGITCVVTATNGSAVLTFTMVNVKFPRQSPATPGREEILLPLRGIAYKSGSTASVVCTLNPGP